MSSTEASNNQPNSMQSQNADTRSRFTFGFRPGLEEKFQDNYYSRLSPAVITVAGFGVVLSAYRLAFGLVLLNVGMERYEDRFENYWDFYFWACPQKELWDATIVEPVLQGLVCLAVVVCGTFIFRNGQPLHRRMMLRRQLVSAPCS